MKTPSNFNRKAIFTRSIIFFILISLFSCESGEEPYYPGSLPVIPVNLEAFNSEYDDFNSAAPTSGWLIPFCFSTNRNSQGENFDIIYQPMNVNFTKSTGILNVTNEYSNWGIFREKYDIIKDGLDKINTPGDEYGPYLLTYQNNNFEDIEFLFLYATDSNGPFDINFIWKSDDSDFSEITPANIVNSEYNDLYPTINNDFSRMYFCSDRDNGTFNIFYVELDNNSELISTLSASSYSEVFKETELSGPHEDKCPFIFGNTLVFTSDRPGGYGGFDLYYSRFTNGKWGAPVNFGPEINSGYDEYRPVIFDEGVDEMKNMMVFSSNRPGGKGGYDLYFVGVDKY
ncbi:MAG: TolB family protein [Bacteroidales bacterium]